MERHPTAGCTATLVMRTAELLGTSCAVSRAWRDDPELRLRLAVLLGAVADVLAGPEKSDRVFLEARKWFTSDDVTWPFSFLRICEALGVDAERLRKRLEPRFVVLPPSRRWARPRFWMQANARLEALGLGNG